MVRWKRGERGQGVRQALAYALGGSCDARLEPTRMAEGVEAAVGYAARRAHRFVAEGDTITVDALDADQLATWIDGSDPETREPRGRLNRRPDADLLLDATINAPKSFSIAALLDPDISVAFDALQDRIRDRAIDLWRRELNARRGRAGAIREDLARIEVVELRHERSRSLDPHRHRHLWLNVRVLGQDGKWSNVDSRVAIRFQNLVNAEGELAARTDPQWIAALAGKGLALDVNGEIAQLVPFVRPLSRRANQIESNRAKKLAQWREEHPGGEPNAKDFAAIDQWAWAHDRPNKPSAIDEDSWRQRVLDEIAEIAPIEMSFRLREPISPRSHRLQDADKVFLARVAVHNADRRSVGSGGRFSVVDVRAGALRAVSTAGIVATRSEFDELVCDVVDQVMRVHVQDLVPGTDDVPAHVKSLMALSTVRVKADLAATLERITRAGAPASEASIRASSLKVGLERPLDRGQDAAAMAIAGSDRLVTVTGPAGAGKTTMLKVAVAALRSRGRSCIVVAPTRKAAGVAGREAGTPASSLHSLLLDHGWVFGEDQAGAAFWHQLRPGDTDPRGRVYTGPIRYRLRPGDRIVVDEAGMVDLHAARALAVVAEQTGAGVAMMGDPRQLSPVGHYGAMALVRNAATANTELAEVHRFRRDDGTPDEAYAALTLRMREPKDRDDAVAIAQELLSRGQILTADSNSTAREVMVQYYLRNVAAGRTVAIVVSTNEEANAVNESVQRELLARGSLRADRPAEGRDGQTLYVGDVVQSRRNNSTEGVENREQWRVERIRHDGRIGVVSMDSASRRRTISASYCREHVQLSYATTAHGSQGETTDAAVVGPDVDAAGLYVGLTRGRSQNNYVTTAHSTDAIVDELANTMMRGRSEVTLADHIDAAIADLAAAARPPESAAEVEEVGRPNEHPVSAPPMDDEWISACTAASDDDLGAATRSRHPSRSVAPSRTLFGTPLSSRGGPER